MRRGHWSRSFAALSIAVAVVGGGGAPAAAGGAPETSAGFQSGGVSIITFKSAAREGLDLGWADGDRINLVQLKIYPDRNLRSLSVPTPAGARLLTVFVAYSS